ncbi:MAG: DOMON-like domain-containing protein [Hyphomonadaceae bacterium]|nr:DOMON-like domain-containing protein [Hyphomonadaceae bacterium]
MRVELRPHPNTPCAAVTAIEVDAERAGAVLRLRYSLRGRLEDVLVPAPAYAERADGLWRETCFEAFVRGGDARYCEFNFAPSTRWAAYAFEDYRAGMRDFEVAPLLIEAETAADALTLEAAVAPGEAGLWRVALSAVIEETSGAKSYWALKHPPGKPDFHHADGFVLELP